MKKKSSKLPDFSKMTREEEAHFWDTHSFTDFWNEFEDIELTVNLHKPKEETLVVRMQKNVKEKLEQIAKSKGLNVSALARMWLIERLHANHQKAKQG